MAVSINKDYKGMNPILLLWKFGDNEGQNMKNPAKTKEENSGDGSKRKIGQRSI